MRVAAPPVDDAANAALIAALAEACGVPRSSVLLEAGARAREKRVSLPFGAAERLRGLGSRPEL